MLSLMDPVELDDLVVFRDDEDPRKFFLLPDQPTISVDEDGEPEFLFVKYIKDLETIADDAEASGGYIQLRTTLTVGADRRQRVVDALRARLEQEKTDGKKPFGVAITSTEPLLASPLWTSGRASLATFQVSDDGLVRHATKEADVDLAGDLGASFSLDLDANGSEIFWGAFKTFGAQVPILINYQLKYKARVSARMTISAKREVIHRQVWQHARPYRLVVDRFPRYVALAASGPMTTASLVALKAQWHAPVAAMIELPHIRSAVQETIITNAIDVRIETDQAGGGEDEAKVRELMFKVASEVLSDRLIPTLFGAGASLPGAASEQDTTPTKRLIEVKEEAGSDGSASFDLKLDHQTGIERGVNPNGPIQLAVSAPDKLVNCFSEVRTGDGFYKELRVTVSTAGVNFERDGIDKIQVWLVYDEIDELHTDRRRVLRQSDGILTSEKESLKFGRFDLARAANGTHKRQYRYRTKVFYKQGPPSPPGDDGWATSSDRLLTITAASMGAIRVDLVLTAPKSVESARVSLRHKTASNTFETDIELTPEAGRRTWFQFTGAAAASGDTPVPPRYSYRVRYRVGGSEIATDWTEATTDLLEIAGPFRKTLSFTVRPGGAFDGVASIGGDITYEDPAHDYRITRSFQLLALTDAFVFDVPILEGGPEKARWTARVKMADGSHEDLPEQEGPPGTVWLGQGGSKILVVKVLADLIDFEADVQLALVQVSYDDPANGITDRQTLTFSKTAKGPQTWRVALKDNSPRTYNADIRFIAYDRTKNSQVSRQAINEQVLLLDRAQV
jgi:hypothetical protein